MSDAHCNNLAQRKALGLVTHDNTGGPFVVECHGCGVVYPSFQCNGGGQIADTGDYDDTHCPNCGQVDPEECENAGLAWNTQQLKINELQQRLTAADEANDMHTQDTLERLKHIDTLRDRVEVLEGLLRDAPRGVPGFGKWSAKVLDALKPADEFLGSTCNEVREEAGLPINRPCKACNGSACIDR